MKKILFIALMLTMGVSAFSQKGKSLQANVLYGSKIETVGLGLTFNLTGQKHEFSPSLNVYIPKDGMNLVDISLDYHRLFGIGESIKIFPIIGFSLNSWSGSGIEAQTKAGVNLGIGGRYNLNEKFDVGFQFKYAAMSSSGSQSVPMLTFSYKL